MKCGLASFSGGSDCTDCGAPSVTRRQRNHAKKTIGEPCAGKLLARFERGMRKRARRASTAPLTTNERRAPLSGTADAGGGGRSVPPRLLITCLPCIPDPVDGERGGDARLLADLDLGPEGQVIVSLLLIILLAQVAEPNVQVAKAAKLAAVRPQHPCSAARGRPGTRGFRLRHRRIHISPYTW